MYSVVNFNKYETLYTYSYWMYAEMKEFILTETLISLLKRIY